MPISNYLTPGFSSGDKNLDKKNKALLDAINTYTKNTSVLTTLGDKDPSKKPGKGFLTSTLSKLAIPGNIIRAGLMEATGMTTPDLENASGLDEFKQLLTGKIQPGFGQTQLLTTNPDDNLATKIVKYGTSLVGDVVTDPISYVGAPGALSRDAAAQLLVRHSLSDTSKFVEKLAELSPNSTAFIDDLASKSRQAITNSKRQELIPSANPEGLLTQSNDILAKQYVANHLAEGLKAGGRKEVLTRLTDLLGSKQAALQAFSILPEEVKGGVVVTNILGRPITQPNGEYIRLTPGTGESLGKFGEGLNKLRLGASVLKGPITRNMGQAGEILANVNKNLWKNNGKTGADRFIDYVGTKDAFRIGGRVLEELQGAITSAVSFANHNKEYARQLPNFTDEAFDATFRKAWHSPLSIKPNVSAVDKLAIDGANALRESMNALHKEMNDMGIEVGVIGDPETWTPLVLDEASLKAQKATERGRMNGSEYSTNFGRLRYMFFEQNAKEARQKGFQAKIKVKNKETGEYELVDNKDVYYNNAQSANEIEKALDPNTTVHYEEDPVKAFVAYASSAANRMSVKKIVDVMNEFGTIIKDIPAIRTIVDAKTGANLTKLMTIAEPDIKKFYDEQMDAYNKQLDAVVNPDKLNDLKTELTAARDASKARYDNAEKAVASVRVENDKASIELRKTTPNFVKSYNQLNKFEKDVLDVSNAYNEMSKVVTSVTKGIAKLKDDVDLNTELLRLLKEEVSTNKNKEVVSILKKNIEEIKASTKTSKLAINPEELLLELSTQLRDTAFILRDHKIAVKAINEVMDATSYANAVQNKINQLEKLKAAKEELTAQRREYNRVSVKQAIEDVDQLDSVVNDFLTSKKAFNEYKFNTKYSITDFRKKLKAELDDIRYTIDPAKLTELEADVAAKIKNAIELRNLKLKELETVYKAKRQGIKDLLGSTSNRLLDKKLGNYVKYTILASERLSDDEFQAYKVLSSSSTVDKLLDSINDPNIPDDIRNQIFGDLVRTFETIRTVMPAEAFTSADEATKYMLSKRGIDNIKKDIFDSKQKASEFGQYLGAEGMQILNLNKVTRDFFASNGVVKIMENMYGIKANPTQFENFITDVIDPLLNLWKWVVTLGRGPGFVTTNIAGGLSMNFAADVKLIYHKQAAEDLWQFHNTVAKLMKTNPERSYPENVKAAEEILSEINPRIKTHLKKFLDYGGIANTESTATINMLKKAGFDVPEAVFQGGVANRIVYKNAPANDAEAKYREVIDFILSNPVSRAFTDMGQSSELFLRYAAFLDGMAKYGDVNTAMDRVYLLHFNYQDLSGAEQKIRRLVPFYTWTRNNVPAQFRLLIMKPGKIQRFMYANQEFQNQFSSDDAWMQQVLPEFIVNQDGFASRFKFGGNNIAMFLKLPYEDLNRLFTPTGMPKLQEIASMLGPATKTPLEVATGTNLSTGQTANPAGESVPGYYNIFAPLGLIKSTTDGDTKANSKLVRFMNDIFPFLGTAERTAAAAATFIPGTQPNLLFSQNQQNAGLSNLLNVTGIGGAGGFSTTTLTPATFSAEINKRIAKQRPIIKDLAASGNYDTDWIRKQLRIGKTPQEIAIMLQSGQGQVTVNTNNPTGITPEATIKYKKSLGML